MPPDLNSEAGWTSAHLYFDGELYGVRADQVITNIVAPFAERCLKYRLADSYFFVRFSDPAPHVRLRLHGQPPDLDGIFKPLLATQGWETVTAVSLHPYVPELDRYGGPYGLEVSETVFFASSRAADGLLRDLGGAQNLRRGRAALAMVILLHAMYETPDDAMRLLELYSTGYLSGLTPSEDGRRELARAFHMGFERQACVLEDLVAEVWRRGDERALLSPSLDAYRCQLEDARVRLQDHVSEGRVTVPGQAAPSVAGALRHLVPSYLHMMNNRMGVSVLDEAYLGNIITRTLGEMAAMEPFAHAR